MLIRLAVENFYSIKDRQELDLRVPLTTPSDDARFAPIAAGSSKRVPKIVAIFGANASGKSTFLRAVDFLDAFINRSFSLFPAGKPINVKPFACRECMSGMSKFEFEYVRPVVMGSGVALRREAHYRYELNIQHTDASNYVAWESLKRSSKGGKFRTLFERTGRDENTVTVKTFDDFGLKSNDPRLTAVRPNASVVSTLIQFAHPESEAIGEDFELIWSNSTELKVAYHNAATVHYARDDGYLAELNNFIRTVDLGIEKVYLDETDGVKQPKFVHYGLEQHQELLSESQGTRNFYGIFPIISMTIALGGTAIIDEIDSDLHPLVMPEILRWYIDPLINKYNAQLIISCQNATLLEHLLKEEVVFTEKDKQGATHVYSLREIAGVRRDTNLYAKYLSGSFGAVPHVG